MGYTHYWKMRKYTPEQFKKFSETCKKLADNLPDGVDLAGPMGTGEPVFSDSVVEFNGRAPHEYESFEIGEGRDWNFCKTQNRPYDIMVCAALLAAYEYIGAIPSSDGDIDDWSDAIEFYESVTGNKAHTNWMK